MSQLTLRAPACVRSASAQDAPLTPADLRQAAQAIARLLGLGGHRRLYLRRRGDGRLIGRVTIYLDRMSSERSYCFWSNRRAMDLALSLAVFARWAGHPALGADLGRAVSRWRRERNGIAPGTRQVFGAIEWAFLQSRLDLVLPDEFGEQLQQFICDFMD